MRARDTCSEVIPLSQYFTTLSSCFFNFCQAMLIKSRTAIVHNTHVAKTTFEVSTLP